MAVYLHSCVGFRSGFRRHSNFFWPDYSSLAVGGRVLRSQNRQCLAGGFRVRCGVEGGESERRGEEAPESLFIKEVKKRGMNTSSRIEGSPEEEIGISKTNLVSTEIEDSLSNQRERSMALNSEGIEGLIPRAKLLLATGGTFFIGFWPIIVVVVAFFSALYLYLGSSFIHDASNTHAVPYSYIDPSTLLEDVLWSRQSSRPKKPRSKFVSSKKLKVDATSFYEFVAIQTSEIMTTKSIANDLPLNFANRELLQPCGVS